MSLKILILSSENKSHFLSVGKGLTACRKYFLRLFPIVSKSGTSVITLMKYNQIFRIICRFFLNKSQHLLFRLHTSFCTVQASIFDLETKKPYPSFLLRTSLQSLSRHFYVSNFVISCWSIALQLNESLEWMLSANG